MKAVDIKMYEYERDFFMRQIKEISRFLANILFQKDIPTVKIIEEDGEVGAEGLLYLHLKQMISNGEINKAENILFEEINDSESDILLGVALQFYNDLQELSDEYLEEHEFSREEIFDGLNEMQSIFNKRIP